MVDSQREIEALANLEKKLTKGREERKMRLGSAKENEQQAREIFKGVTDFLSSSDRQKAKGQRDLALEASKGAIGFARNTGSAGAETLLGLQESLDRLSRKEGVITEVQKIRIELLD